MLGKEPFKGTESNRHLPAFCELVRVPAVQRCAPPSNISTTILHQQTALPLSYPRHQIVWSREWDSNPHNDTAYEAAELPVLYPAMWGFDGTPA